MTNSAPRPDSVPAAQPKLRITAVPDTGGISVIWLSRPVGILTHGPALRAACPGPLHCKECPAGKRTVWKGFAPVCVWVEEATGNRWEETVLEVSERLAELLSDSVLRGQVWYLYRQVGDGKYREVAGHQVDQLSPSEVSVPFDVTPVVQRAYRSASILFGAKSPLKPRPNANPVELDYAPPTATPRQPTQAEVQKLEEERRAGVRAALEEAKRKGLYVPEPAKGGAK